MTELRVLCRALGMHLALARGAEDVAAQAEAFAKEIEAFSRPRHVGDRPRADRVSGGVWAGDMADIDRLG